MKPFREIDAKVLNPEWLQSELGSHLCAGILSQLELQIPVEDRMIGDQERLSQPAHLANRSSGT